MSNILPQKQIAKLARMYRKRFMVVVFVAVTVIFAAGCIMLAPSIYYARAEQATLAAKKASLDSLQTGGYRQALIASIGDIDTRLQVFGQVTAASPVVGSFLNSVLAAKTADIQIAGMQSQVEALNPAKADITVRGTAKTREALLYFSNTLSGYPGISDVNVPVDTFIRNTDVPFILTATVTLR